MLTLPEAATRLGIPLRTLQHLCATGQVAGAQKIGRDWIISDDAAIDPRPVGRPPKVPS